MGFRAIITLEDPVAGRKSQSNEQVFDTREDAEAFNEWYQNSRALVLAMYEAKGGTATFDVEEVETE
jgi:hypothetical protein